MLVTIIPNPIINDASNNEQNSPILFSDPGFYFSHKQGSISHLPHNTSVSFPRFDQLALYAHLKNWKVAIYMGNTGAFPWAYSNPDSFIGLGTPGFDATGKPIYTRDLEFKFYNLEYFGPGTYHSYATIEIIADNIITGEQKKIVFERTYPMAVIVANPKPSFFYATYFKKINNALIFNYYLNSEGFASQSVFTYFSVGYDISLNDLSGLLSYSQNNLSDYDILELKFKNPVTAPNVGLIQSELVLLPIAEGAVPIIIPIKIFVFEETLSDLSVSPEDVYFEDVVGVLPKPESQYLSLVSNSAWKITNNYFPFWLQLDKTMGAGNSTIKLDISSNLFLQPAKRNFVLTIKNNTKEISVNVNYNSYAYLESPFIVGKLFFTKDLDFLTFHTPLIDTFIEITLIIKIYSYKTNVKTEYIRTYNVPFFKKSSQFHLGTVVHQLLDDLESLDQVIDNFSTNYICNQYRPAEVSVLYKEKSFNSPNTIKSGRIDDILMIKGNNPGLAKKQLGLLDTAQQEITRVTPNSILSLNFCNPHTSKLSIKKNGVTNEQIVLPFKKELPLYSYFRFDSSLVVGDVVEFTFYNDLQAFNKRPVDFESKSKRFLVFPEGKESTHIFFQNSWGLVEAFEFTGRRKLISQYDHTVRTKFKNLSEAEVKILTKNKQNIIVNTGYLLPSDHRIIDAIIKSPNVWCSFDSTQGPYFKINCISTKIINKDTDSEELSYDVEFNIIDNADVAIFIQ